MVMDRSLDLRELAQRVVDGLPFAEEALLTGSASRGEADELSDEELLLVAEELPPIASLSARLAATGMRVADEGEQTDGQALWLNAVAGGDCVEAMGWTHARAEERVEGILAGTVGYWREPSRSVRAHLRPGGRLPFSQVLAEDAQDVLRIVFAVNRVWERRGGSGSSASWSRCPSSRTRRGRCGTCARSCWRRSSSHPSSPA
jgi:hypothetical protein